MRSVLIFAVLLSSAGRAVCAEDSATVLAKILAEKGTITSAELSRVESAESTDRVNILASILSDKGVITANDVARLSRSSTAETALAKPQPKAPAAPKVAAEIPPVTSASKLPVTVYGTLLLNAFFDTSLNNIQDIPLFAGKQGSDALGNDKSFGMTARQSRIGLRYTGPTVAGARISGQAEVDFLGGKAAFGNGINMDLVRLRLAFGRLDWKNVSLVAGQDWSVFAPLNPTTLAEFAIPGLSASGNPWIRMPQLRLEFHNDLSDATRILFQIAAVDPDFGDFNTTAFTSGRTPGIGERGRYPGADSRLSLTTKSSGRDFTIGASSHYARGKNAGTVGPATIQAGVDSWGAAIDYSLPVSSKFALTGEWYIGRALGIFSVESGEGVLPVGTPGQRGVPARGGWSQGQFNFTPKWQLNLAYGIDSEKTRNLRVGDRNKNQTYLGNVIYKYSPHVNFAWEWRRFLTNWKDQRTANEIGDQLNMAIAYIF